MSKKLKHVFFDLDHTLWDFEKNSALAFAEIFNKNKIEVDLLQFLKSYKPINNLYWSQYRKDEVSKENLRFGRLNDTFKELKINVSDAQINTLADDYISYLPKHNFLFDDVTSTLISLQKKYVLHIITNGFSEVQQLKLNNSNINNYFTTVTTSEEVGVKKPHPEIFKYALHKAQAIASESLMIGDNLETDILGAEASGIQTILYDIDNSIVYSGNKIKKLKQILDLI
ncbi:YjjG family noncanonical pyrimidine nucleotidase [Mesonia aestuariivivens]|uniref:YjjG family noncanonical pyrimidine nucleotidase n=1 Tax=Mesonia aestuariivivens TaxID=2796128 RepID=A0ABS6W304_9FLAO|nr:YjjG family noncanonical pyrimidine nucleotidase [Mesonia aestuariivivens]MBW2962232.1 YjjG family noncanonical pyrimidine nucleotidase [Mesonia aestuariivivens]